jgi:vancomycin resistance protein VanJ
MPRGTSLRSWLWRASVAAFALLVLLAFLEACVAERWWVTTLLTYAPQYPALLLPALLLALALLLRHWRAAALNGLAFAAGVVVFLGVRLPLHAAPATGDPPLRVMTYNLERFMRATPKQIRALAEREHVDVLCVQEATPPDSPETSPDLRRAFARWHQVARGEMATFSRYPIVRQQLHPFPDTARPVVETVIGYRGRRVTILNVHFSVAVLPQRLQQQRGSVPNYLRHTAEIRARQTAALLALARQVDGPVLVVGDFNTPPRGLVYRQLTSQLDDAFTAAGLGAGNTYSARRPLLRIDYVFTRAPAQVARCRVLADPRLSDHRPLLAEVVLAPADHS